MSRPRVDLTNCDLEPIHTPGSIQPHGCLLVCDASATRIQRTSANVADYFGAPVLGADLSDVLGAKLAHDVRNGLTSATDPARPALLFGRRTANGRRVDMTAHVYRGASIIEIENADEHESPALSIMRGLVARLRGARSVDQLLSATPRLLRALLGYDRVMIYSFAPDGSGAVIAEARKPALESFMGQRFPATDIPQQARRLYLQNTIRIISDASGAASPVVPEFDDAGEPLDLSFAHLRSVSPIHCEYLRNMGVAASMSVSIIVDGALWGLVVCHHYEPKSLTLNHRVATEMFGEFMSLQLSALLHEDRLNTARQARQSLDVLLSKAARSEDLFEFLSDSLDAIGELLPCDGVALAMGGRWATRGYVPPESQLPIIARFLNADREQGVFATNRLADRLPTAIDYARDAGGMLSVPLSQSSGDYLLLFRRELEQTILWAGDPNKTYTVGPLGDRLTPRRSFAIWKEIVKGRSAPWSEADREIAETARIYFVEIVLQNRELLDDEREKASVRQHILSQELNHRVKNILALIKSLVSQPVQPDAGIPDFVASLKGRIQALAVAHDQVVRGDGGGSLRSLLNAELSPYRSRDRSIVVEGPDMDLDARAYSVMALILHELATNAAKYGSLSVSSGALHVSWSVPAYGGCEIVWRETGGPIVAAPARSGFGSTLINRSLPHDLNGSSSIAYEPAGVVGRFHLPARHVTSGAGERRREDVAATTGAPPLAARSALILEDQFMIALDAEEILASAGVSDIEIRSRVADALSLLETWRPDVGVLDVNLGSETSQPVAERLRELAVPFVFATGYESGGLFQRGAASAVTIRKPYDHATLLEALGRAVAQGERQ